MNPYREFLHQFQISIYVHCTSDPSFEIRRVYPTGRAGWRYSKVQVEKGSPRLKHDLVSRKIDK